MPPVVAAWAAIVCAACCCCCLCGSSVIFPDLQPEDVHCDLRFKVGPPAFCADSFAFEPCCGLGFNFSLGPKLLVCQRCTKGGDRARIPPNVELFSWREAWAGYATWDERSSFGCSGRPVSRVVEMMISTETSPVRG